MIILYTNEDSSDVIFSCYEMGILSVDLKIINLDYTNYNEDYPESISHVRLLDQHSKFEKCKALKKKLNKKLMLVVWHPRR